jgi:LAO/AO transport system kinase
MPLTDPGELARRLLDGDRRALARALTEIENETSQGLETLRLVFPSAAGARIIGITGSAGSGKSTLTAGLARAYRGIGKRVGIVAVDPSSPYTRGAILGDRIRMQDLTADSGIFLRSVATRGSIGGLSATTAGVAAALAAAGSDVVLIETVGAGQDEVEIAGVAQTTLVLNTPGMGDDVQAIKAGIIEIADVLVVNKADLAGADAVASQLKALLSFAPSGSWDVPVVQVSALRQEGIDDLLRQIEAHGSHLRESGEGAMLQKRQAEHEILLAARAELVRRLGSGAGANRLAALSELVAARELDPRSAALQLMDGTV